MIPLFKPFVPDEFDAQTFFKTDNLAMSPICDQFEAELQKYFDTPNVLAINTFNNALLIICRLLDLRPGDIVVSSPMACLASTQPFAFMGIRFIWCDVDPHSGTLCPESVNHALKNYNVKAILHNHFAGYSGNIDAISKISKKFGVPVVNDCIEAFGSKYHGEIAPFFNSEFTIFSGNPVRFLNTVEGALLVINDPAMRDKAIKLRDTGIDRLKFRDNLGEISPACDVSLLGLSATPNSIFSALGLAQLKQVDNIIKKHRSNALRLSPFLDLEVEKTSKEDPNYWVLGGLYQNKREFIEFMQNEGINTSSVHLRNDKYSIFSDSISLDLCGVQEFSEKFVAIPCGWWLSEKDLNNIELSLKKWFNSRRKYV